MRYRIWAVIGVALLAVALSSCTASRTARGPVTTPVPTKTLRPTFTHTPAKPTMTAAPTEVPATATSEAPAATPEPPTEVPSPTSEVSKLTANAALTCAAAPAPTIRRSVVCRPGSPLSSPARIQPATGGSSISTARAAGYWENWCGRVAVNACKWPRTSHPRRRLVLDRPPVPRQNRSRSHSRNRSHSRLPRPISLSQLDLPLSQTPMTTPPYAADLLTTSPVVPDRPGF